VHLHVLVQRRDEEVIFVQRPDVAAMRETVDIDLIVARLPIDAGPD
jgi:hypothetical protein